MARITIEDCTALVPNRFVLVRMVRLRARQLKRGAAPLVERGDNRDVVTALREVARGRVRLDEPRDEAV
jgi:DNA-directed RNA polymerase subunit omega